MKRIFVFLMLAFLVFACTATAPRLAPTDTLSSTPTPLATVTSAQSSTRWSKMRRENMGIFDFRI